MYSRKNTRAAGAALVAGTILVAALAGCNQTESAEQLVAQAKQFQQKGDFKSAQIQLKNALQASPDDAQARYLLAAVYIESGDALAAEKEIRRALALRYPETQAMPVLAKALLLQGQYEKVLADTEEASKQGGAELLCLRADAYLAMGKRDQAQALFEGVQRSQPAYIPALLGLGRIAFINRDADGAAKLVEQALAAEPKNVDALVFKAELLRARNEHAQALAAYDQVLAAKPAHRTAHIDKAYLEIASGKFDAAQGDLAAAAKITPGNLMVSYTQALLDFSQGKNAAAQESLQKVLRAAPEHMPTILLAGAVNLNLGSVQQAEQYLKKYLEKNPGNLYARKMLATTLLRGGQSPDALAVLAPALKEAQPDAQLLALAGESYMQARDFSKASEYFEKASELEPKVATLRTSLGLSKLGKGEQAHAISDLELATTLDANSLPAGIALVRAEIGLKHYDKALEAAAKLEKAQPDNPLVHELKGAAHLGKGDSAASRASFERALVLRPNYYPAVASLVQLDMIARQPEQARQRLLAFLEQDKQSIDAMTALAGLAGSQGQAADATGWLEKAHAAKPDAVAPAIRLAVQYLRSNQQQKALSLARKLQVANPAHVEVLDLLGQAQLAGDHPGDAVETYSVLVRTAPRSALAQFRLAGAYLRNGNQGGAADGLKKALALQPDFLEAQLAQAELDVRAGHPERALAVARQIQKQRPQLATGFMLEGDLQAVQKQLEPAVAAFSKAIALNPEPGPKIKLAAVLKQAGKDKDAEQRLLRWIKEAQAPVPLQLYLAELYLGSGQNKQATEQLQAVLQQQPKNVGALNNLAWAYQQAKDGRALATAEQAQQLAPDNPAVLDTLGWVLVEQGNMARALPLLQKAAAQDPAALDIRYHLAYGYHKAGNKEAARKELDQIFATGKSFAQLDEARTLRKQL